MACNPSPTTKIPSRSARFFAAFILASMLFALGQFHRTSGSVLSSVFAADFALRSHQIGVVIGIMFLAQGLGQIPSGILLDRYGARRALTAMGVVAAAGCAIVAAAGNWGVLMLGRALIGLGFSAAVMGGFKLFAAWVSEDATTAITGRYLFFGMLGGLLATTPLTLMLEEYGWRMVFVFFAAGTATVALLFYLVVRDAPPGTQILPLRKPESLEDSLRGVASVFATRKVWPLLLAAPMLYTPVQILAGLWALPYLADVHGLNPLERSYCLVVLIVFLSLGPLIYGTLDRRLRSRRTLIVIGATLMGLDFLLLALFGHIHWMLATALCAFACGLSTFFMLIMAHAQSLFPSSYSGRVISTIGVLSLGGVFLTQSASAVLLGLFPEPGATASATGYSVLFASVGVIGLGVSLICRRIPRAD
jgi:MFS family permease